MTFVTIVQKTSTNEIVDCFANPRLAAASVELTCSNLSPDKKEEVRNQFYTTQIMVKQEVDHL